MSRSLRLAALTVSLGLSFASAAIWPQQFGPYQRLSASPVDLPPNSKAQLDEDGLDAIERADYGPFQVTASRFKDVTGAYAASLDPSSKSALRVGNYLVACQGKCPKNLAALADAALPHVSHGSLPTLDNYFPSKNLVPRSERYILGPAGLAANAPEIPAAAALFDFGTEAALAHYRSLGGTVTLIVFSYPTPSVARQQLPQFQKIQDAAVKRTGPLIAVLLGHGAASPDSAKLLTDLNYDGVVAENEQPAAKPLELKPESAGKMVLAILSLAGLLLVFCLLSGLAVGGTLHLARKFGYSGAEGSLITLHLEGK
ncbi:MAG: hypothetical protein JOZ32_16165 [Bryobacterales bacterium]|nr:hypothetical protein [Bryobacterales bacterium]